MLELEWLHRQMNRELWDAVAPLFALFELKTIILCLRNLAIHRSSAVESLLRHSLLAGSVRDALRSGQNLRSVIADLADAMSKASEDFRSLEGLYLDNDLRGFEEGLMRLFLQDVAKRRLHPVLTRFFVLFTDLRNIMLLYKHLRWKLGEECSFITGGSVETSRLQGVLSRRNADELDRLVRSVTGLRSVSVAATEGTLETLLLRSMTRSLGKIGRVSEDVGLLAVYAWRVYCQARNLAVLHHGKRLDAQTLERELIL